MRNIYYLLAGTRFESSSYATEQFLDFYKKFSNSIKVELRKLKATKIEIHRGHFDAYGFFTVGEQIFYFSLSDVRSNNTNLLIRTANSYSDYSGGSNNYVEIHTGMAKKIANIYRLELANPTKTKKVIDVVKLTETLKTEGHIKVKLTSNKAAYNLAWNLSKNVGQSFGSIGGWRNGRTLTRICQENELVNFNYECGSKTFTMNLKGFEKQALLNSLQKYDEGCNVMNPYSKESCYLDAEQLALYDFVKGAEMMQSKNFSLALQIFREKYPQEYMVLLD